MTPDYLLNSDAHQLPKSALAYKWGDSAMENQTNSKISPWHSLKNRVTIFTLVIFVNSLWALSFYASRMLQEDMQRVLGEQQYSVVSLVASEINDELVNRVEALERIAKEIDALLIGNPAGLQARLEQRPLLQHLFNGGILVTGTDGTAIADVPLSAGRIGTNYMDRDSIGGPLKQGKTVISRPVMGKKLGAPVFSIGAPIRDGAGTVIGTLVGTVNLGLPNFLDKITGGKYGRSGGFLVIEPSERLIISATDRTRVMERLPAIGLIAGMDRMLDGFEGTDIFINALGKEVMNSGRIIPIAGWRAVVTIPTIEALSPIYQQRQRMLWATVLLTLLTGGLTWWMLRRQLSPMLNTAQKLTRLATTNLPVKPLPVTRQDEIGAMIGGFNHLLETLGNRETALVDSEFRWKFAIDGSGDGLWDWNVLQGTVFFSTRWKEMLGFTEDEIGNSLSEWSQRIYPDELARVMADVQSHLDGLTPIYLHEYRILCKDGSWKWIHDRGLVVSRDEAGKPLRVIGTHADITEWHQAEAERNALQEQIRQMAYFDPLTQLPNRRLIDDRLGQALAASKRSGQHGALMFLDLDNFKPLNDTHGHGAGDLLLIEVARRLTDCVRETDSVARLGGDEFVVLLSELNVDYAVSTEQATAVAEKIRTALAMPYQLTVTQSGTADSTVQHHCSASVGVVIFLNHEASPTDLMKWADSAMYQAKDAGRNAIRFYESNPPIAPVNTA